MDELREGVELYSVFWPDGATQEVGKHGVVSIVVREQVGEMAMVPWIELTTDSGTKYLYNPKTIDGVRFADQ